MYIYIFFLLRAVKLSQTLCTSELGVIFVIDFVANKSIIRNAAM